MELGVGGVGGLLDQISWWLFSSDKKLSPAWAGASTLRKLIQKKKFRVGGGAGRWLNQMKIKQAGAWAELDSISNIGLYRARRIS